MTFHTVTFLLSVVAAQAYVILIFIIYSNSNDISELKWLTQCRIYVSEVGINAVQVASANLNLVLYAIMSIKFSAPLEPTWKHMLIFTNERMSVKLDTKR